MISPSRVEIHPEITGNPRKGGKQLHEILTCVTAGVEPEEGHTAKEARSRRQTKPRDDPTCVRHLEPSNSQRQEAEWWVSGAEGVRDEELGGKGHKVSVWE